MKNLILTSFTLVFIYNLNAQTELEFKSGTPFLLGEIAQEHLEKTPYKNWFAPNFEKATIDQNLITPLAEKITHKKILLFMGTWCGDSKREVPTILKLLQELNFPNNQLEIIAVDGRKEFYKTSPDGKATTYNLKRVPTLIILENNEELNRIVETPIISWEADLLAILNQQKYVPKYTTNRIE